MDGIIFTPSLANTGIHKKQYYFDDFFLLNFGH